MQATSETKGPMDRSRSLDGQDHHLRQGCKHQWNGKIEQQVDAKVGHRARLPPENGCSATRINAIAGNKVCKHVHPIALEKQGSCSKLLERHVQHPFFVQFGP